MLNHVIEYAKKYVRDSEPGFTKRNVHWSAHISSDGKYINVEPFGDKKGSEELCPNTPKMNAGGEAQKAHFLVENLTYAILYDQKKESAFRIKNENQNRNDYEKSIRRHEFFKNLLAQSSDSITQIGSLITFLKNEEEIRKLRCAVGENGAKPTQYITFYIDNINLLRDEKVLSWWRLWLLRDAQRHAKKSSSALDLITGERISPKDSHPGIKGLRDVGASQENIPLICFDKPSYCSYGLRKGENASVSENNAQLYADGIAHVLKSSSHSIAGARFAYWFKENIITEEDPLKFLNDFDSEETKEGSAQIAVRNLLESIQTGKRSDLANNRYFILTLSGASGRVMVRDWLEGNFPELLESIDAWFSDLEITSLNGLKIAPIQKFETVITSLLLEKKPDQKYSNWIKPIGSLRAPILCAALRKQILPALVLLRLLPLLPSFLIKKEVQELLLVNRDMQDNSHEKALLTSRLYARMGLIRAYFFRLKPGGDSTMTAYLNPEHPSPAYHCGRLLAILSKLQHAALGDVGAGVVQRYYSAASQTPGLILGRLIANSRHHLSKLDGGLEWWYEEQIADPMSRLGDEIPKILDLNGQGLFALGYYQQLATLRAGNKNTEPKQGE
jgi:CRISPR-associated protein Csd1